MLLAKELGFRPEDTVLILPAVSVGNVGQMAVDLLIKNLDLRYLCPVDGHDCALPIVGSDFFGGDRLCTSFEAYYNADVRVLAFQQRSDFLRAKKKAYLARLSSWLKQSRFRAIFVLTSIFAHERDDSEMAANPLQLRTTAAADKYLEGSEGSLERCIALKMPWPAVGGGRQENGRVLPGGGIARALYEFCANEKLPLLVVSKYCAEGDNTRDSCEVASACAGLLGLAKLPKEWRIPGVWQIE